MPCRWEFAGVGEVARGQWQWGEHRHLQWREWGQWPFSTPDVCFDQIHIDLVWPLPPSLGYTYTLTCIDRFTHWPKAFPLNNITADSVAHAFMSGWISQFGTPSTITTDRGSQFESSLWHSLMHLLGSSRLRTTAYHTVANGLVNSIASSRLPSRPSQVQWNPSKADTTGTTERSVEVSKHELEGDCGYCFGHVGVVRKSKSCYLCLVCHALLSEWVSL